MTSLPFYMREYNHKNMLDHQHVSRYKFKHTKMQEYLNAERLTCKYAESFAFLYISK